LILYILNATQIGVQGDYNLLDKIQKTLKNDPAKKILFLLNKADQLDSDKGETLPSVIANVQKYLTNIGFKQPDIVPLSVQAALLAQKALNKENLTRSELSSLANNLSFLDNDEFINSAIIPSKTKSALLKKQQKISDTGELIIRGKPFSIKSLKQLKTNSGFDLIKMMLQQYLPDTQHQAKSQKNTSGDIQIHIEHNPIAIEPTLFIDSALPTSNTNKDTQDKNMKTQKIHIEHNPFTIETVFLINGNTTDEATFERYKSTRLQSWVVQLFTDLVPYFNGIKAFEITFKRVESDWFDLVSAADDASSRGFNINMTHIPTRESSERLADIQALMKEATNHPVFGEEIRKNNYIQRHFEEANNRDFDVYVAATMSAGKSTFINAMLGCELLPAANEATTATIATITDNDNYKVGQFRGQRINKDDQTVDEEEHVTLTTMQEWNGKKDTKLIELEGNILGIKEREEVRLKITDTPGPNNSQDAEHAHVTMSHIRDSKRNPLIIYLLNGTQLAVKDDKAVLTEIAEIMQTGGKQSQDRFIFVANKMDQFDPEKGETIDKALINIRTYLETCGIKNPQIYPISAIATLLHRKKMNGLKLTKTENALLYHFELLFGEPEDENDLLVDFVQHMPLTQTAKRDLENKNLVGVEYRSGVAAIESMIDEYIFKYNVPNRVFRGYQALSEAIKETTNTAELKNLAEKYSNELLQAEEEIILLKTDRSRAINLENEIKQELSSRKENFIEKNIVEIDKIEAKIRERIHTFGKKFSGTVNKNHADNEINNLISDIRREYSQIINELELLHGKAQTNMREQLSEIFQNRVKKEITNLEKLPLPLLDGLKHKFASLEKLSDLGLSTSEVHKRKETKQVKTGTRKVSTSKWYKPWTWGDEEFVDIYETREEIKQEVNLLTVWTSRRPLILDQFEKLTDAAAKKLIDDTEILAREFTEFMQKEFLKHIDLILEDLLSASHNSELLKTNKEKAEKDLIEIAHFDKKLQA
ncbi:MAG: hypothetical protein GX853_04030, partial [Chloroflexi bacterium]|nr:hypothetical protein [Chloroflexota bacterium]